MRVLFSSTSGLGHVYPLVPLARALLDGGHDVLWAVGADARAAVEACGVPTVVCGGARDVLGAIRADVFSVAKRLPPPEQAAYLFPRWFGGQVPSMVDGLLPLAHDWRPDLLVHEQAELASPLVAAVVGVASVTTAFGGHVPAAFVAAAGERLAPLWAAHGLTVPPYAGCYGSLYLDICPPSVQTVPGDHVPHRQPLRPVAMTGPPPSATPDYFAAVDRPLVYLTLGTVRHDASVLRAAVAATAALPVRVLVALGPGGDASALGEVPAHVRVEQWVHQPQVLEHAAVVVSHGGSGTFLGALAQGLPQLCLPQAADQFRNAEGGVRSGAALALRPSETDVKAVRAAVERLLAEPSFSTAATVVADEIAAMPSPAEVVEVLEARFGSAPTIEP
ncbi:glycosyltransferase [Nocardioides rubriscoriae]|uniref:glycosyltransferase n=1 Tax=Nocardioides rubriscoriae TaxID=642762 RepID=UPI0011DFDF8F|nr:nucleotide disphospho-sugar-binding domain-containing protein [Nocardioides rubriscoriae]